jgi:hypothetical protein
MVNGLLVNIGASERCDHFNVTIRRGRSLLLCAPGDSGILQLSRPPSAGESGVDPPPKAQPAPGNAQATGTALGSGISGKPAGSPSARRTDGVRNAQGTSIRAL